MTKSALALVGLTLVGCAQQNTLPCAVYAPRPEKVNPGRTPEQIKSVNTICNTLNAVDTDRCVLTTNLRYENVRLCDPQESNVPITPEMTKEVWENVEKPLRDCGHSPLADTIQDELKKLDEETASATKAKQK